MREDHQDIQTPKKEHLPVFPNRKAKLHNAPSKKLHHHQKSIKKNLSSIFTPITEDDVIINLPEEESIEKISSISESVDIDQSTVEISKTSLHSDHIPVSDNSVALQRSEPEESDGTSPISETFVYDKDQFSESIESYIASLNQFVSPSSVIPLSSISTVETTPSSPITAEADAVLVASVTRDGATAEETDSLKLDSLVKHLKVSMFQVLHSADIDPEYKKLLDALVKMMIEEFYGLHEERDLDLVVDQLFSRKLKTVLLSFLLCVLAGFIIVLDVQSSYHGPPPT